MGVGLLVVGRCAQKVVNWSMAEVPVASGSSLNFLSSVSLQQGVWGGPWCVKSPGLTGQKGRDGFGHDAVGLLSDRDRTRKEQHIRPLPHCAVFIAVSKAQGIILHLFLTGQEAKLTMFRKQKCRSWEQHHCLAWKHCPRAMRGNPHVAPKIQKASQPLGKQTIKHRMILDTNHLLQQLSVGSSAKQVKPLQSTRRPEVHHTGRDPHECLFATHRGQALHKQGQMPCRQHTTRAPLQYA